MHLNITREVATSTHSPAPNDDWLSVMHEQQGQLAQPDTTGTTSKVTS